MHIYSSLSRKRSPLSPTRNAKVRYGTRDRDADEIIRYPVRYTVSLTEIICYPLSLNRVKLPGITDLRYHRSLNRCVSSPCEIIYRTDRIPSTKNGLGSAEPHKTYQKYLDLLKSPVSSVLCVLV